MKMNRSQCNNPCVRTATTFTILTASNYGPTHLQLFIHSLLWKKDVPCKATVLSQGKGKSKYTMKVSSE